MMPCKHDWIGDADCPVCWAEDKERALKERIAELKADNQRLREALERIILTRASGVCPHLIENAETKSIARNALPQGVDDGDI
jgi:hypothetical protein